MVWHFLAALGGIGLFLVGMSLLTEGLRGLAGGKMRMILARFTRTPLSGAITGTVLTALVQSSSAITVAAVGFVASGMLTFAQALGIVFGANIGTTLTGWLVAGLGFRLDLGTAVLPVVFIGAVLNLTGWTKPATIGRALVGFGLLFIGIEFLKSGLGAFGGLVTPDDFPRDSLAGRLLLVGIGLAITLVTHSSSAGVATALAALAAGAISFPQAAAMVIGMDVGTTFTALLAAVGGGTMARRTGLAHVIYNLLTGGVAFFLLGPYAALTASWVAQGAGQIALVTFHSFFNVLGVVLVLPFTRSFARLIEYLVPERGSPLTLGLDRALLAEPKIAAGLAVACLQRLNSAVCDHLGAALDGRATSVTAQRDAAEIKEALIELRDYLGAVRLPEQERRLAAAVGDSFHMLDHLLRLLRRSTQTDRIATLGGTARLRRLRALLSGAVSEQADPRDPVALQEKLRRLRDLLDGQKPHARDHVLRDAVSGRITSEEALAALDALRWLERSAHHLWRIRVHQNAVAAAHPEQLR